MAREAGRGLAELHKVESRGSILGWTHWGEALIHLPKEGLMGCYLICVGREAVEPMDELNPQSRRRWLVPRFPIK
jgi:hypothetical protein